MIKNIPLGLSITDAIGLIPTGAFIAENANRVTDGFGASDDALRVALFLLLARAQDGHQQIGFSAEACISMLAQLQRWVDVLRAEDTGESQFNSVAIWLDTMIQHWPEPIRGPFNPQFIIQTEHGIQLKRHAALERELKTALEKRIWACPAEIPSVWSEAVSTTVSYMEATHGILLEPEQRRAVEQSHQPLLIVTGGPGTGKTTVIASIVHAWQQQRGDSSLSDVRIALAAPTARAATRISDALRRQSVTAPPAMTVHSLLRMSPDSHRAAYYNSQNPLDLDLLIVDEVSMLDTQLLTSIIDAMPDHATLILVGDPFQLPSVEAGSVLSNLMVLRDHPLPRVTKMVVTLGRSLRSTDELSAIAESCLAEDPATTIQLLGVRVIDDVMEEGVISGFDALVGTYQRHRPLLSVTGTLSCMADLVNISTTLFKELKAFQVICPVRYQVVQLNRLFSMQAKPDSIRPIIMTKNNYGLKIMNGEIGFVATVSDERVAMFEPKQESHVDSDETPLPRIVPLASLTDYDDAWAITVHKSQGSEWDHVEIILPFTINALCTRELVYTALTRAKHTVLFHSSPVVLMASLSQRVFRDSNLGVTLSAINVRI